MQRFTSPFIYAFVSGEQQAVDSTTKTSVNCQDEFKSSQNAIMVNREQVKVLSLPGSNGNITPQLDFCPRTEQELQATGQPRNLFYSLQSLDVSVVTGSIRESN